MPELMTILFSILDLGKRVQVVKAMQEGEFSIAPLFPFPDGSNKFAGKAYRRLITRQERCTFWFNLPEESFLVRFPVNSGWKAAYELLAPRKREAKAEKKEQFQVNFKESNAKKAPLLNHLAAVLKAAGFKWRP